MFKDINKKFKVERLKVAYKKLLRKIRKYFSTNILFLTYLITSVFISFLLRYFTIGIINDFKAIFCDLVVVMLLGSFGYLVKPKHQFKYFLGLSIFNTFLCILNHIYYTFYMSFVSVSLLGTLSMLGEVSDSVTNKLEILYFIYLIAPLMLIVVNRFLSKRKYHFIVGKYENGKKMFIRTSLLSFICLVFLLTTLSNSEGSRLVKQWNRDFIVQRFGLYFYTANDFIQSIQPSISPMFGYDSAAKMFRDFYSDKDYTKDKNEYTDIFKGKNVIFIHGESIQNYLIDLAVNGIEITPNLNKIAHEGLYFSSFYPQISIGTSSDTEFTLSTSLLPSSSGTVFVNYANRNYETIQKKFKSLGYYTFSMHANAASYWNRETMYKSLGYDKFYAKDSFIVPEDTDDANFIGLGLSDKSFFKQIMPILEELRNSEQPFMGTVITLSNHSPFADVDKYGKLDFSITFEKGTGEFDNNGVEIRETVTVPYLENTEMGNYLKSAHYADEALGEFFEALKVSGMFEDTVIVFYGDHESKLGKKNLSLLYNYDPMTESIKSEDDPTFVSFDNYKYDLIKNTPLIIWTGDDTLKREVTDVMGMWDVMPTIANMFGFDYKYALGNDIFSDNEKLVVFPNGDVLTNKVFYNNLRDEYIPLTEEPIDTQYIERLKEYAEVRLDVSKSIIVHDLIEKEENNLERVILNEKDK